MPRVEANGIEIAYEIDGPADGLPLLMIHGLGAQLTRWPPSLCDRLIEGGFRLIRIDNRDVGLSTHFDHAPIPDLGEVVRAKAEGREPDIPYRLADMAADAAGLLDTLEIASAHVVGVSLGGMVAQVLAMRHPGRVRSLALVMTQSGNPELPPSQPEAIGALTKPAPDPVLEREAFLDHQVALNRALGSPLYPTSEEELRHFAALAADRAYNPAGSARQLAASRGSADRRAELRKLAIPTLVIHGADDPLILPVAGDDLAEAIPGAWLLKINGMGHDLPEPLFGIFVASIAANAARAA